MRELNKIRVLIVDDSFFTRKLLREILHSDPRIEIVGEAKDGAVAVEETLRLKPDVITMDYKMPKMNGAAATRMILDKTETSPAILMISSYTQEGAKETWESLRAGAVDFIAKPSSEIAMDLGKVGNEILLKIKAAAMARIVRNRDLNVRRHKRKKKFALGAQFNIVVIGASTGGPPVLEDLFSGFPAELQAAFLIVQHMPPKFTKSFAERLDKASALAIKEAEEGDVLLPGLAFVAPGDFHMEVRMGMERDSLRTIHLTQNLPEHGLRPAIDITMRSAAASLRNLVIGVVLTGMGEDGKRGMQEIKAVGGHTIVQDPKSAVLDSMPKAVIEAGLADEILSPQKIVKRIIELTA